MIAASLILYVIATGFLISAALGAWILLTDGKEVPVMIVGILSFSLTSAGFFAAADMIWRAA